MWTIFSSCIYNSFHCRIFLQIVCAHFYRNILFLYLEADMPVYTERSWVEKWSEIEINCCKRLQDLKIYPNSFCLMLWNLSVLWYSNIFHDHPPSIQKVRLKIYKREKPSASCCWLQTLFSPFAAPLLCREIHCSCISLLLLFIYQLCFFFSFDK